MTDKVASGNSQQQKFENVRKQLQDLKAQISQQSKRNFELDRDVRFFDKRIALLINHRISVEELSNRIDQQYKRVGVIKDELERQVFGQLFYLLQTEPYYVAQLTRSVSLNEIDDLLETVMFSLYGNQYEEREEHLLLCMFELALKYEFDEADGFNNVLRANTAVSRMMASYTRRGPGQEYLKETLEAPIRSVIEETDLDLEINPMKVYAALYDLDKDDLGIVSAEQISDDRKVQATIEIRLKKLEKLAETFLNIMECSVEKVPFGIRWICFTVKKLAVEKFPNLFQDFDLTRNKSCDDRICSLIGGFFLLRFINPAIVSPHVYMLISKQPNSTMKRNLVLIAKIIQHTANVSSGKTLFKEDYMQPLQTFVEKHKKQLCSFLNDLCNVPPFYSSLEMELYMGLSKDTQISITLNQIHHIHKLLLKYKQGLGLTEDDPLNTILSDMVAPRQECNYHENFSITLTLKSRWEQVPVVRSESLESTLARKIDNSAQRSQWKKLLAELFSMRPELLLEQTLMSALIEAVNLPDSETAVSALSKFLLQKCEHIQQAGPPFLEDDDFYEEVKEVHSKLHQFDNLCVQLESLQRVYKTICDHKNFLEEQLVAYKEYLEVVRERAASKDGGLVQVTRQKSTGSVKFSFSQLEKDGVIIECHDVADKRKSNLFFTIKSPSRGIYKVALLSKDCPGVTLAQAELRLEELLELQYLRHPVLNLNESVLLDVRRTMLLLHKHFNTS